MKYIVIHILMILAFNGWSQSELNCSGNWNNNTLELTISNSGIDGPTRIKLDKSITNVESANLKGATIMESEGQMVLIWTNIPQDNVTYMELACIGKSESIGELFYLNDGEKVKTPISNNSGIAKVVSSKVPKIFQPLDLNKDDGISLEEINGAINGFFEEENDLTPDDLKDLVNYFFDQD